MPKTITTTTSFYEYKITVAPRPCENPSDPQNHGGGYITADNISDARKKAEQIYPPSRYFIVELKETQRYEHQTKEISSLTQS